jgi:hypothetical protein
VAVDRQIIAPESLLAPQLIEGAFLLR